MKRISMVVGFAAAVSGSQALALEIDPQSRQKAVVAAATSTPVVSIPAALAPGAALPDIPGMDLGDRSATCASEATDLCYDYKAGRLVYRPSRNWMPEIGGLKPEHISVRRDSVVFRYSFR
ncbi:hypothetical protein BWI17_20955 [Betaproteobacteria bacterium GR16-43]|nr:hypothetical protein BWI17_20955 [Betaproteobacteria bacterium GR16-43]